MINADLAPTPPGVPYHRLARTSRYFWWRPLLELVLAAMVGVTLLVIATGLALVMTDTVDDPEKMLEVDGALGLVALAIPIWILWPTAWFSTLIAGNRQPGALSSVEGRIRWRWLGACFLAAIAIWSIYVVAGGVLGVSPGAESVVRWPGWAEFLPLAAVVLLVIPIQATAEEYFFRGLLLQAAGALSKSPWLAILLTAVLFGAAHLLEIQGFVAITIFGVVAAWLAIRTGGLEAPIALHVVNNVSAFLWTAAAGQSESWVSTLNEGIGWAESAVDAVMIVTYGAIIARLYRRRERAKASP